MKGLDGRATAGGAANDPRPVSVPDEVARPMLPAWVEEHDAPPRSWIPGMGLGALETVAHAAGEPEVLLVVRPAAGVRDDVFDLERIVDVVLRA